MTISTLSRSWPRSCPPALCGPRAREFTAPKAWPSLRTCAYTTRARRHRHTHTHTHTHTCTHARTMSDAIVYATCVCKHTGMAQADRQWSPCLRADGICKCPRLFPGPSTHAREDNRHRFSSVPKAPLCLHAFGLHWSRGRRHLDAPCLLVCAVSRRHGWAYACWTEDGKLI
jgi:hypothetical protein